MILQAIFLFVLSAASLGCVWRILRSADRVSFPSTYVMPRAPEVLVVFDDFSPIDWKGLA
ncbi:MAG: hypothetical protein ACXVGC_09800 [Mycobacteriaceae bacterium]